MFYLLPTPLHLRAESNDKFKVDEILFFEAPDSPQEKDNRVYSSSFPKSKSRYIWCEIDVTNLLYKQSLHDHKVVWKYYKPDGSLQGEMKADFGIKPEWYTAWHQHGWGWDEVGHWAVGTYRVEVFIDDQKIGSKNFTIYDDTATSSKEYEYIKFFESPYDPTPLEQRSYSNEFLKSKARYIYTEIGLKNLLYNVRDQKITLFYRYYDPEGKLWGSLEDIRDFPADWESGVFWHGWGWKTAGNWKPGNYRVEVILNNSKIAEGTFYITDDTK
jgi:hypothetical protein